jgi:HAD superfamily hydrolase (TIGR01490 family)
MADPVSPLAPTRELTLFDLDNTLLPIDSDHQWGEFLVRRGAVDAVWYQRRNDEFFEAYKAGTLDMDEFLAFVLAPLARIERAELDVLHVDFMRDVIEPSIRPVARALVDRHLAAGDLCAVVTATNAFVVAPIVRTFGVPHLVATVPEEIDGRFTGALHGQACFREGKLVCVEQWLMRLGLCWEDFAHTRFYSDSKNDLPLLERVTEPVATNPDETLEALATARGWRILRLFTTEHG